jgi:hypothetical protein
MIRLHWGIGVYPLMTDYAKGGLVFFLGLDLLLHRARPAGFAAVQRRRLTVASTRRSSWAAVSPCPIVGGALGARAGTGPRLRLQTAALPHGPTYRLSAGNRQGKTPLFR